MAGDDIARMLVGLKKVSDCSRLRSLSRVGRPELVGLAGKEIRVVLGVSAAVRSSCATVKWGPVC